MTRCRGVLEAPVTIRDQLDLSVWPTDAAIGACSRGEEAGNEATRVTVDFHLLAGLADRLEGLLLHGADIDVAVSQRRSGWATVRFRDSKVIVSVG